MVETGQEMLVKQKCTLPVIGVLHPKCVKSSESSCTSKGHFAARAKYLSVHVDRDILAQKGVTTNDESRCWYFWVLEVEG
jgi:hypothetical protein